MNQAGCPLDRAVCHRTAAKRHRRRVDRILGQPLSELAVIFHTGWFWQ
jgi:hypothetical protein